MPRMNPNEAEMRELAKKLKFLEDEDEQPGPKNKKSRSEKDKALAQERSLANFSKDRAWAIEESNMEHLVAYRSTGGWWKFGGNSAEFFAYAVAKQIGVTANLRFDEDKYRKFSRGIVSIRSIVKMEEMLKLAGYEKNEELSIPKILVVFNLEHPYTPEEMNGMRKAARDEIEMINRQFIRTRPTWQNVDFYTRIRRMIEILNRKSTSLSAFQAQAITQPMMKDLSDLYLEYFRLISKKTYEPREFLAAFERMKGVTEDLSVRVMILAEIKAWGKLAMVDFAAHAKEAEILINKEYERTLQEVAELDAAEAEAGTEDN